MALKLGNKNWSTKTDVVTDGKAPEVLPVNKLDEDAANTRNMTLLKAMIAVAKADGHIDAGEMWDINQKISDFGLLGDVAGFVQA